MLAWHIGFHDARSKAVAYVPGTITGIVIITTSLMLVRNANLYARVMADFGQVVSPVWIRILWGMLAVLIIWIVVVVGLRTFGLLIRVEDGSRDLQDVLSLRSRPLALATLGAAFLAVAGPAFASVATDTYLLRDSTTGVPTTVGIVLGIMVAVLPEYLICFRWCCRCPGRASRFPWRRSRNGEANDVTASSPRYLAPNQLAPAASSCWASAGPSRSGTAADIPNR